MPNFYDDINGRGSIIFGGGASTDYGIVISEAPTFEQPKRKTTVFNIPGRNGSVLFQQNAFDDVTRSYNIYILPVMSVDSGGSESGSLAETVNAITSWLNSKTGYQVLTDNFEPDVYRLAYYSGNNNITNELTQYGATTLTFTARPERFLVSASEPVTVINGSTLHNPTLFTSKPLIYLEGSGIYTIKINDIGITADVDDYIYIDCERMTAYRTSSENMNNKIGGTFPSLVPGNNSIALVGTPTLATVTPNYFYI